MLLALGLLVYTRFDDYWPRVRAAVSPASLWRSAFGPSEAEAPALALVWSRDSSRVALECPRGLTGDCCETLEPASPELCAEASALLAKARWKKAVSGTGNPPLQPLRLEGRAVVSDLGDWTYELSGLGGRDPSGAFQYRREQRTSGTTAWCDTRRGCLKDPAPRAPLANGRMHVGGEAARRDGASLWTAGDPEVRAVLPGRVVAAEAVQDMKGVTIVRVYHGRELYADYGPLQAATGVKPGALVRSGSHLGFAPRHPAGYALQVRLRQGGQNLDPAAFWGVRPAEELLLSGTP
jgi:hypothetical protein